MRARYENGVEIRWRMPHWPAVDLQVCVILGPQQHACAGPRAPSRGSGLAASLETRGDQLAPPGAPSPRTEFLALQDLNCWNERCNETKMELCLTCRVR